MNTNFNIILKNNEEFINIMNSLLQNFCSSDKYNPVLSLIDRRKSIRVFFEYIFSDYNLNYNESIKIIPPSKILEKMGRDLFRFEDKKGALEWSLGLDNNEMKFEIINTQLMIHKKIEINFECVAYFNEEFSIIEWYCAKNESKGQVYLTKPEIDQELIDFNQITRDVDISFLKDIRVNDIVYDISNLKRIVRDHIKIENKKNKLEI